MSLFLTKRIGVVCDAAAIECDGIPDLAVKLGGLDTSSVKIVDRTENVLAKQISAHSCELVVKVGKNDRRRYAVAWIS